MNRKQRIEMIKQITVLGTQIDVSTFGLQPVCRLSPFNCYLKPKGLREVRYAWTSIHDLLKDKIIQYNDQHLQAKIEVSFNR